MKLYYVPGVCSLCPHIVLREGGFDFTLDLVDVKNGKKTQSGEDYVAINPRGYVPALRLDDGKILHEAAVIVQFLADQKPESKLAPPNGTMARVELQEWLNFISSELHKGMSVFFQPAATEELRAVFKARLDARFGVLAEQVKGTWLMGEQFTVADAYAFYVMRMFMKNPAIKGELNDTLRAYYQRIAARPAVQAALTAEQLDA
ncbi:MAG: glutathione transferase GstA [Archangium gephyra]|uniref:Glutathione transferase GstA n=1 Tax=Archangium gephyra TaxID=48 RepID=A0A2W5U895_9BACT|nr:MAG: glutathione transferase GstA [Archangium gephyra]